MPRPLTLPQRAAPLPALAVVVLSVLPGPLEAQYRGPRSADYLFAGSAWGARALWVNPAALAAVDGASIMLEGMIERNGAGDYPFAQYTIGFNSRGLGLGFRHDFFQGDVGGNTWRVGFGRTLGALGLGAAISLYSGDDTKQDVDVGLRYRLSPALVLALGAEHIGQPTLRDSSLRFGGTAAVSWTGLGGALGLDVEARGSDQEVEDGVLMAYRAGLRLHLGSRLPIGLGAVIQLDDGFEATQLLVGLAIGRDYQAILVGGSVRPAGDTRVTGVSLAAQASRRFR
jgi:hypothetical protein